MTSAKFSLNLFAVALAAALWGTVGIVAQFLYDSEVTALTVGFYRLVLSVPPLFGVLAVVLRRDTFRVSIKNLRFMLLMGAMLAIYQLCYFASITFVGVSVATLVTLCTAPIWIVVLSWIFLNEVLSKRVQLSLLLALLGTFLLLGLDVEAEIFSTSMTGILLALGSALGYAVFALSSRHIASEYHPLKPIAFAFVFASLLLLPFALHNDIAINFSARQWLMLSYLGAIPTAFAYTIFIYGMRRVTATSAGIITLLEPLTATIFAWFLFAEELTVVSILGGILLIAAIILLSKKR